MHKAEILQSNYAEKHVNELLKQNMEKLYAKIEKSFKS